MRETMRFFHQHAMLLCGMLFFIPPASAQNAGDFINLFGGLLQGAITQTAQAEWKKLPQSELSCIDRSLRNSGTSLSIAMQRGIGPADARLFNIRAECREAATPPSAPDNSVYFVANTRPPDAYLALRTHPSSSVGRRVTTMPNDTTLRVLQKRDDGWWNVEVIASGQQGWAFSGTADRPLIDCCISSPTPRPPSPRDAELLWDLNGSKLSLVAAGRSRKFIYKEPRVVIRDLGVKEGSLLFEGEATSDQYRGTAYFTNKCGRTPVAVTGPILDGYRRVELRGQVPNLDSSCRITGYTESTLALQLIEPATTAPAVATRPEPQQPTTAAAVASRETRELEDFKATKDKALAGDAEAQIKLADLYATGKGTKNDPTESVNWLRKSAEQGSATGQTKLADVYMFGLGVPEDNKEAAVWYGRAAEKGDANSQHKLGLMYDKGAGVEQNGAKAIELIRKAADQGHQGAKNHVANVTSTLTRIRSMIDRISANSEKVANAGIRQSLRSKAEALGKASDTMTTAELKAAQDDVETVNRLFQESDQFDRTSRAASGKLDGLDQAMSKVYFDAPLIQEIRTAMAAARKAVADANLSSLREQLSKLDLLYDPKRIALLREATLHGFSTIEAYDQYLTERAKLGRSGIILKQQ